MSAPALAGLVGETAARDPEPLIRERTTADVLRAAARYIEEHGWTQAAYEDEERGHVCVLGSINAVTTGVPTIHDEQGVGNAAELALEEFLGDRSAVRWNDEAKRTEQEVLAALRAAADRADR